VFPLRFARSLVLQKRIVLPKFFLFVERPDIYPFARSALDHETVVTFAGDVSIRAFAGTLQVISALGNVGHEQILLLLFRCGK
jgi:hypothetical protein